jgi:hypothetical protein
MSAMKKLTALPAVLLLAAVLLPATARATAIIGRGTSEIGVDGSIAAHSADGTTFDLGIRYSYFFWDSISVGILFDAYHAEHSDIDRFGPVVEYDWRMGDNYRALVGSDFVPYIAAGILAASADVYDHDATGVVFRGEPGLKFFLTDTAALVASLVVEWATDDIYRDKKDTAVWDLSAHLGLRLLF